MSNRNRARDEIADRRFAEASRTGTRASQTSNFGSETPYLSLGNVTREECAKAAATITDIVLRVGHGKQCGLTVEPDKDACTHPGHLWDMAVSDMLLDMLKLKEFAR